jgi:hypothetical protein
MKIKSTSGLLLIVLLIFNSCRNTPAEPVAAGKLENQVYSNAFFDVSMEVPEDWIVETLGEVEKTRELAGKNKPDEILAANLLIIYKDDKKDEFKPNLAITAEHSTLYPESKSKNGKDYLKQVKKQFDNVPSSASEVVPSTLANNIECHSFEATMNLPDIEMSQSYFSIVRKKFYLNFTITYQTDSQKEELMSILNTLQID